MPRCGTGSDVDVTTKLAATLSGLSSPPAGALGTTYQCHPTTKSTPRAYRNHAQVEVATASGFSLAASGRAMARRPPRRVGGQGTTIAMRPAADLPEENRRGQRSTILGHNG